MIFDTPATTNPIDQLKVIGQPADRVDGPRKVSGKAPYADERHDMVPDPAYGVILGSAIAKGRIISIDSRDAESAPGVLAIVTADNAGKLGKASNHTAHMLAGPTVEHYDQAVALVVAESFEQARAAAALIRVVYERTEGAFDLAAVKDKAIKPEEGLGGPADTAVGDFAGALASATIKLDQLYTTPDQSNSMMEPHATTARSEEPPAGTEFISPCSYRWAPLEKNKKQ